MSLAKLGPFGRFGCLAVMLGMGILAGRLPAATPLKVACVGDSITEGSGLANPATESYPAKLQKLLGAGWQVRNFGVSGRTLLRQGDFPYWREAAYTQSRNYAPDVVVIKLGTNDTKPQNWRHGTNFIGDFEALIASYTNLASRPRIVLCAPCPVFGRGAFDIRPGVIDTNIAPAVRELGDRLGVEVIDFRERLAGRAEWFPDTVHPNSRGTTVMAAIAWSALTRAPEPFPTVSLAAGVIANNRVVLGWPVEGAGYILESATLPVGATTRWTVVEQAAGNDGTRVRVTNSISGALKLYRLRQP